MRYEIGWFAAAVSALLTGCGAANLANFTGYSVAERDEASTWTQAHGRTATQPAPPAAMLPVSQAEESTGRFTVLTYNVAGLPQLVSPSSPRVNIPLVSPLLNAYDIALVQEDFSYHRELIARVLHPYRSRPMRPRSLVGDGLSQFARFEFSAVHRVRWGRCNGFVSSATDCLADKGFSFSELTLAPGVTLHVYNLHADSGSGKLDIEARAHNFEQLARYIAESSTAQAVIVGGDTNLHTTDPDDAAILAAFLRRVGLRDACSSSECWQEAPIDRVLFRSSPRLGLSMVRWWRDTRFVDKRGHGLSDHPAIGVDMRWERSNDAQRVAHRALP